MIEFGIPIIVSLFMGLFARIYMIRIDQRQYPSYPQGLISHLTLGLIASFLGSVAVPSLINKEFGAVTFLALAAQQFRDVRSMERQSLDNIEPTELVSRGMAYIEDIAKAFEARNYMVIITALITSCAIFSTKYMNFNIYIQVISGILSGSIIAIILKGLLRRQLIMEIANVNEAKIDFDGPILKVNGVSIMNIGLKESREIYLKYGIAIEIVPNDSNARATLGNIGQRQAIVHNAAIQLGLKKDVDTPDFTPIARRNLENGNIVMAMVPMVSDTQLLVESVKTTPVLETSKRKPLQSKVGYKASKEE
ncbi:YIEGIA family protein [Lutibacter sp. B2]|nr:YIEGIA family protein [Lutibacter sp. B2]